MIAFLFDLDGTLLTTEGVGRAALKQASADAFGVAEDLTGVTIAGNTDAKIAREILAKHDLAANETSVNRLLGAYLAHLAAGLRTNPGRTLPGIPALLDALAATDHSVGLLTGNARRGAELKLDAHGLARRFRFGAFGDDSVDRNCLGDIALERARAVAKAEVAPGDAFVIGDTPRDVACGRACGARTVAVATGQYSVDELADTRPDFLFRDFSDLGRVRAELGF